MVFIHVTTMAKAKTTAKQQKTATTEAATTSTRYYNRY